MPLYTLQCECGHKDEYLFGMNEEDATGQCEACGAIVSRRTQRVYFDDLPYMQSGGGSCGSMNWNYYDEALGQNVHGRKHRGELMEQAGLMEYDPHPDDSKHLENIRQISKERKKGDKSVESELKTETSLLHKKRQRRVIDKAWKKHAPTTKEILSEVGYE